MKITIVGSLKFKDLIIKTYNNLSLNGHIVYLPALYDKSESRNFSDHTLKRLKELHRKKIEESDAIFVINKCGYIGESMKQEIDYAKQLGKEINYMYKMEVSNE